MPRYPRKYRRTRRGEGQIFSEPRTARLNTKLTATALKILLLKSRWLEIPPTVLIELLIRRVETYPELIKLRKAAKQLGFGLDAQPKKDPFGEEDA